MSWFFTTVSKTKERIRTIGKDNTDFYKEVNF